MFEEKKVRPARLSHIGIQTYNIEKIRDWYCLALNAEVVVERIPDFSTLTFDREHHRLAIVGLKGDPSAKDAKAPGIFHAAYSMENIFRLLENYERLRDSDIRPVRAVHHGVILSMYYVDPDGNTCELVADRFATFEESINFMRGPVFRHTLGAPGYFDPDEMLTRMKNGATADELLAYDEEAAMKIDFEAERRKTQAIYAGKATMNTPSVAQ
jgi:catechol 2,3-dioxygenase-like lactoylglutathione lyase family enzyme